MIVLGDRNTQLKVAGSRDVDGDLWMHLDDCEGLHTFYLIKDEQVMLFNHLKQIIEGENE